MSFSTQVSAGQTPNGPSEASRVVPDDGLAALIYHVSALAHAEIEIRELVERTGSLVLYSLHADSTRIVLRDAQTGSPATFSDSRARTSSGPAAFLFSRPVSVRGVQYGQLEIGIGQASVNGAGCRPRRF